MVAARKIGCLEYLSDYTPTTYIIPRYTLSTYILKSGREKFDIKDTSYTIEIPVIT